MNSQTILHSLNERSAPAAYQQAARQLRSLDDGRRSVKVAQLSTFTIENYVPYFEVAAARRSFAVQSYIGPLNSVHQQLRDSSAMIAGAAPDLVFISQMLEDACPILLESVLSFSEHEINQQIDQTIQTLVDSIRSFRQQANSTIVVHNFALPPYSELGILEANRTDTQTGLIRRLNARTRDALAEINGVYILDFDRLCADTGYQNWFEPRMWFIARAPLSREMHIQLANVQAMCLQASIQPARKCLVLDLDNTLWGGIIGEDGAANIKLGSTYPGNVYQAIQRAAFKLYQRGVLLAICSKNNPEDADPILAEHPDMVLRPEHFAARRINWNRKSQNLVEIAAELNIGVDSLVFLDDSPAETAEVQAALPDVAVFAACDAKGQADPLAALRFLERADFFQSLALTDEDRQRGTIYRQQSLRRQLSKQQTSLSDFLQSLELRVTIKSVDQQSISRAGELTRKTNQFNLTTRRYTDAELSACLDSDDYYGFTVRVVDRFGDSGIVGLAIIHLVSQVATIDSFLLSCRVIGKEIETALLVYLIEWSRNNGAREMTGTFIPTPKNGPATDFFERHGFTRLSPTGNLKSGDTWRLNDLTRGPEWPAHICVVDHPEPVQAASSR